MMHHNLKSLLAASTLCAVLFASRPTQAAIITWNNTGGTGDGVTWDINNNQNWNNGAPTVYNDGDNVNFNDTNNSNYSITVSGSVAPATFTATNTANAYTMTLGSGQTLTVNGLTTIGQTALALPTKVILTGGGSYLQQSSVSTDYLMLSPTNALGTAPVATLDASGLSSFTYNDSASQVLVGVGARTLGNLLLPTSASSTSSITAAQLRIGDSVPLTGSTGNNGGTSTLTLGGGTNTIDASTIMIGNGKQSGVMQATAGGSITIAGTTGGSSTASITIGRQSSATGTGTASQLLLAGATATVQGGTVIVGDLNGATSGTATGVVTFDAGTFGATSLLQIAADLSGNSPSGTKGTFTLGTSASSTGTLNAAAFILGNVTSTSTTVKTDNGTFIINGGTANISNNINSVNAAPATTTLNTTLTLNGGSLNMNGNQIGHASGTSVHIGTINMPGAGKTATLLNLGGTGINDAGLTVNGGGTLVLDGGTGLSAGQLNYSNNTTVTNNSILALDGTYTGTGSFSVNSGSTLQGKGSTTTAVSIAGGGFLAPGDSINTLSVGSATLGGTLNIDINDADANIVDLLNDSGSLDISAGTSAVSFNVTGTLSGTAYVFAKYGSLTGTAFGTVNNLPSGYSIDYDYQGNNDIALVAVPEPSTVLLATTAGLGLILGWRKKSAPRI